MNERLIPAHAGKTSALRREPDPAQAHPRSRGENNQADLQAEEQLGSSPLTRGKRNRGRGRRLLGRLIPAHAGKTTAPPRLAMTQSAHPRSRGEN